MDTLDLRCSCGAYVKMRDASWRVECAREEFEVQHKVAACQMFDNSPRAEQVRQATGRAAKCEGCPDCIAKYRDNPGFYPWHPNWRRCGGVK